MYAARSGGMMALIHMCLTITLPSSEVIQNLGGGGWGGWFTPAEQTRVNRMHPCRASLTLSAGKVWDWKFQFCHASACQRGRVMPAITLTPPSNIDYCTSSCQQAPELPGVGGAKPQSYILDVGISTNENFKRKLTER